MAANLCNLELAFKLKEKPTLGRSILGTESEIILLLSIFEGCKSKRINNIAI